DQMDFVLWKPSTAAHEPGWESPCGYGRPGLHIECTAMINKHLGPTIDIHGGGHDLMFPHHENEVAQGTCCHAEPQDYVRYWMHNGMINVNGEKMSKSLGNFVTVRELLGNFPGEQLRFALLSAQYRSVLNWSEDLLTQGRQTLDRFYGALRETANLADAVTLTPNEIQSSAVVKALCDDLNTPQAIAELHQLANQLYSAQVDPNTKARVRAELVSTGQLMGLLNYAPERWFTDIASQNQAVDATAIEAKISARAAAKKAKNFAQADAIRGELDALGVEIQDTREGTRWQWK
ncbi:MAG: DALR domain-containing protein, partial [Natronospirillum sp.]